MNLTKDEEFKVPRKLLFVIFFALFLIAIVSSQAVGAQGANGDPQSGVLGERAFRKWGAVKDNLDQIAVVPNPYIAAASWERRNFQQSGCGERKLFFIHLPQQATIRIFTIAGQLVDVIEHDSAMGGDFVGFEGAHPWDMRTNEGLDIAFGIYVYHVEVDGVGQKVGKFAVIK